MGGEKQELFWALLCASGSPPHGRGKADVPVHVRTRIGITPAWAGKSQSSFRAVWLHGDHPRMGGEKYGFNQDSSGATGSPPHRRGKVRRIRENLERVGITPAWARKRGRFAERKAPSWDHPRMGGEKTHEQQLRAAYEGSPPRGRGKAWHLSHGLLPCG